MWSGPNQRAWFEEISRETAGMTEPEADRHLRAAALRLLRERPVDFGRAAVARLGRLWGVAPSAAVYPGPLRLLCAAWTAPLWLALALGLCRREARRWPGIAAVGVLAGLTVVHAAYWTDLRMRAPAVPAIALLAAGAGGVRMGPRTSPR